MKPLRTGLGVGLLAGGVGAATKLVKEWRAGTLGQPTANARVVTGAVATADGTSGGTGGAKAATKGVAKAVPGADGESPRARRAARRAAANRPAWVVAPPPGAGSVRPPASTRPTPTAPRKLPSLVPRNPVSAQTVAASVGKFAVKRAGKAIGKVAAERVGKAIEVIEVLEKVVASVSQPSPTPDMTFTGPGAALVPNPARPGEAPSAGDDTGSTTVRPARPRPTGNLVSVRKFERGPRVVVGPSVKTAPAADTPVEPAGTPAAAEAQASSPAAEQTVVEAVDAAADAVMAAVDAAAAQSPDGPADADPAPTPAPRPTAKKRRSTAKAVSNAQPAKAQPATAPSAKAPSGEAASVPSEAPAAKKAAAKRRPAAAKRPPTADNGKG